MPRKIKDLCVKAGSYTDREGNTKNRYENVGLILQMDDGSKMMTLKRTFNPAGVPNPDNRDSVIISVFDVKQEGQAAPSPAPAPAPAPAPKEDFNDTDIPF